jgi:uncharacterized protein (DUF2336 family)
MSRRVTISIPDDVADQLAAIPRRQVSAYVTEALRRRRASDDIRAALTAAGHPDYPYDPDGAADRTAAARVDIAVRDAAIDRFALSIGRPAVEVRAQLDGQAER